MADPQLANTWRVLSILQGASELPEDRYVNSFGFIEDPLDPPNPLTPDEAADALQAVFDSFWGTVHLPGTLSLSAYIGAPVVSGEIRVYRLSDLPPRVPEVRPITNLWNASGSLPAEVALVSSLVAARNLPRSRGRFYLGPLSTAAYTTGTASSDARPSTGVRNALIGASSFLGQSTGHNAPLVSPRTSLRLAVISPTNVSASSVTGGWVDNAFDTQRRRGSAADARDTWGTYTS